MSREPPPYCPPSSRSSAGEEGPGRLERLRPGKPGTFAHHFGSTWTLGTLLCASPVKNTEGDQLPTGVDAQDVERQILQEYLEDKRVSH